MDFVLQTHCLSKRYGSFSALDGLTMSVPRGSVYGFVGRNGAGKTTLLRLICGLQRPTEGEFSLFGVSDHSGEIFQARRRMGAMVETPGLYPELTAGSVGLGCVLFRRKELR